MTSQTDKDWEEFQLGLQGISTGSMYNQLGKDSQMKPSNPSYGKNAKASKPSKSQKANSKNKEKVKNNKSSDGEFSLLFAVITFVVIGLSLYKPETGNGIAALTISGICAAIAGKWYKPIIIIGIIILIALVFSQK